MSAKVVFGLRQVIASAYQPIGGYQLIGHGRHYG